MRFVLLMAFLARALATLALASVASAATLTVGGTSLTLQGGASVCNYTAITESGAGNWSVTCGAGSRTISISPPVNGSVCASFTSITESGAGNWVVAGCGSLSPTITLDAPSQAGQTYLTGTAYTLKATPTAPSGRTVSSVQFFADGNLVHAGTVSGSQYVWDWSPAVGTYQVLARVTDSTGATADSVSRSMIFQAPAPQVQLYYVHPDHLGTPRAITRVSDNQVVWRWDNTEPFGNSQPTGTVVYNLRFPGQYFDAETGKHYNYFRDYDPSIGRYVESDPIGLRGGINTYGYVGGMPLRDIDPQGNFFFLLGAPLAAGGSISLGGLGTAALGGLGAFALMVMPGDSEQAQQRAERNAYHKVCDEPPPPGMSFCDEVRWKVRREKQCIDMRKSYMSKWNDTYEGHSGQISMREMALKRLEQLLAEKCCGK